MMVSSTSLKAFKQFQMCTRFASICCMSCWKVPFKYFSAGGKGYINEKKRQEWMAIKRVWSIRIQCLNAARILARVFFHHKRMVYLKNGISNICTELFFRWYFTSVGVYAEKLFCLSSLKELYNSCSWRYTLEMPKLCVFCCCICWCTDWGLYTSTGLNSLAVNWLVLDDKIWVQISSDISPAELSLRVSEKLKALLTHSTDNRCIILNHVLFLGVSSFGMLVDDGLIFVPVLVFVQFYPKRMVSGKRREVIYIGPYQSTQFKLGKKNLQIYMIYRQLMRFEVLSRNFKTFVKCE